MTISVAPISNLPLHQGYVGLYPCTLAHEHEPSQLINLRLGDGLTSTFLVKTQFEIINWWVVDNESGEQVQADFFLEQKGLKVVFTKPPAINQYTLTLVKK